MRPSISSITKSISCLRCVLFTASSSVGLVVVGTVIGGVTVNPAILGSLTGAGVMYWYQLLKSYKKRVELCTFALTSHEKVLTEIRNFMR